jgi:hypothetical protein
MIDGGGADIGDQMARFSAKMYLKLQGAGDSFPSETCRGTTNSRRGVRGKGGVCARRLRKSNDRGTKARDMSRLPTNPGQGRW